MMDNTINVVNAPKTSTFRCGSNLTSSDRWRLYMPNKA